MFWIVLVLYVIVVITTVCLGKNPHSYVAALALLGLVALGAAILVGAAISQSTNTREVESSKTYKIAQGSTLDYTENAVKFIAEHEDGTLEPLEVQGTIQILNQDEMQGIIEVDSVYREWGGDFWLHWPQNITENKLTVK